MYLFNLLAEPTKGNIVPLIVMGVLIVAFIVMQIISGKQRKKQMEEDQKKKDSLCPGAKVLTIGGISGEVVSVDNENNTFVLQSAGSQILFDKRAIYTMEIPASAKKVEETKEENK